jgi:hypothetical protein
VGKVEDAAVEEISTVALHDSLHRVAPDGLLIPAEADPRRVGDRGVTVLYVEGLLEDRVRPESTYGELRIGVHAFLQRSKRFLMIGGREVADSPHSSEKVVLMEILETS